MIVIDSCGWIAYLAGDARCQAFARLLDRPPERVVVPTLVLFEVCRWVARERSDTAALEIAGLLQSRRIEPLQPQVAVRAVWLARAHKLAAADALIYAHAQCLNAPLATSDAAFAGLPGVILVRMDGRAAPS